MFEMALIVYVVSALVLTLAAAAGSMLLHLIYGPELPPGIRPLDDAFMSVFVLGSSLLLRPFKVFRNRDKSDPLNGPPSDIRQLPP